MLNEDIEKQLKEIFKGLAGDVTIALFTEGDCHTCKETSQFMDEIAILNDKIHLQKYTLANDAALAKRYNVELVPSIVLLDSNGAYRGIRFVGIPAGHEVNSFIAALLGVSGAVSDVPPDVARQINSIDKDVNIKVFVTLGCPHCPGAVRKAHTLALMNSRIEAEMIETQTFSELSGKYNVSGVPKIIINDTYELIGDQPIEAFLSAIGRIG